MKIKTITCHDVYNVGASLQAYALAEYLRQCGHDVEIIDYKPEYLQHYRLLGVKNPRFDKPVLREVYQLLKLPGRVWAKFEKRKKVFDAFRKKYLPITSESFSSNEELKSASLNADLFLAGSDQIWNPVFKNGKDPAFFLDFVDTSCRKSSYAASFAVEKIEDEYIEQMKKWLQKFTDISVRETSALTLLKEMDLQGTLVCDPVFLLPFEHWKEMAKVPEDENYTFVYDFDRNMQVSDIAKHIRTTQAKKIVSLFPMIEADQTYADMGPLEFLGTILNADIVLSNSFHATAFSLIFHKEFFVIRRQENINTRMRDLLRYVGLEDRLIEEPQEVDVVCKIDWKQVDSKLNDLIEKSKDYLRKQTGETE